MLVSTLVGPLIVTLFVGLLTCICITKRRHAPMSCSRDIVRVRADLDRLKTSAAQLKTCTAQLVNSLDRRAQELRVARTRSNQRVKQFTHMAPIGRAIEGGFRFGEMDRDAQRNSIVNDMLRGAPMLERCDDELDTEPEIYYPRIQDVASIDDICLIEL